MTFEHVPLVETVLKKLAVASEARKQRKRKLQNTERNWLDFESGITEVGLFYENASNRSNEVT